MTTSISALENIHKATGRYGDHENKKEQDLIKISETTNLLIFQIVQFKKSTSLLKDIEIQGLHLTNDSLKVTSNHETRILWCGPNNWILTSTNKNTLNDLNKKIPKNDFAITDLSHSRAIIQLEGKNSKEVLKKGCPFNFNELMKDNCVNSLFNGISVTIDMIDDNPNKIRLFALRSFGESLYHSITDASLEFGYINI
jgi:heterotetrameric sarcosine oxidase gamma subunit|tara:strand:- start:4 stop:597 length:594 start_codon:yes stop_codon:yes gene_type:complete